MDRQFFIASAQAMERSMYCIARSYLRCEADCEGLELVAGSGHLGGHVLGDEERFVFFVRFHAYTIATF